MDKLIQALQRLYFLDAQQWHSRQSDAGGRPVFAAQGLLTPELVARSLHGETAIALDLLSQDGGVRAIVVDFASAGDWEAVARLYQGLQDDLELPAPALSVSGESGYQLWLSLAECIPAAQARVFLEALRRKYLADLPLSRIKLRPAAEKSLVDLVPALHGTTGKWSAFIDPEMGAMFIAAPGLEMAPNMDRQADMLSGLASIKTTDLHRALNVLEAAEQDAEHPEQPADQAAADRARPHSKLGVGSDYTDPKRFLLALMNDPSASTGQRIKAAKALLPYFEKTGAERDDG